jgi:hypothetical protein
MAIVASGQVSLGDIQTEYGGSNPIQLSEYYGDGNAPASGEIQLAADFYGTSSNIIGITITSNGGWSTSSNAGNSTNHGHGSSQTIQWTALGSFTTSWSVSSEGSYDWLTVRKNGSQIWRSSGSGGSSTGVVAGTVMWFNYYKDGSVSSGADTGYYSFA